MQTLTLRIPDEVHERLKACAEVERRSLNSEILRAIDAHLAAVAA